MLVDLLLAAAIATATPSPSPSPDIKTIVRATAHGRSENLVGKARAASEGSITIEQIATRPLLRPGEVLEAIPGLVISQHSGGGKANQYYLRGFQLDHGTDLESTIAGFPVNLPSHAHGQGYSDINWLIPETIAYVRFKKGPYYADQGDFSTAGAYDILLRNTIEPTVLYSVGGYGYARFLAAASPRWGGGNLLYAIEYVHDNSTMARPDNYRKYNALLRYSRVRGADSYGVNAVAYGGSWLSSDQIPQRLVDSGAIGRFGLVDPSDAGTSYRFGISADYAHSYARGGTLNASAFAFEQSLDLFSNFTYFADDATDYYNVTANPVTCTATLPTCAPGALRAPGYTSYCPANAAGGAFTFSCGDQREQRDKRLVSGARLVRAFEGRRSSTTFGLSLRSDNVAPVALYLTHDRVPYPNGTLSQAHVVETDAAAFLEHEVRVGSRARIDLGLRADSYDFNVGERDARNSGFRQAGIVSPKVAVTYALSAQSELYLDYGQSFHSNDARGITQTVDPQTHAAIDPNGNPIEHVSPLVRAVGEEIGYRFSGAHVTSTVALWQLNLASELVFDGDHGVTFAGRPTVRRGIELSNFFTPTPHLTVDADLATSSARFLTDPQRIGTNVPESLAAVISAGVTVDQPRYAAALRVRYFGPRNLVEDGSAHSPPSTIVNAQITAKMRSGIGLRLDVLNVLKSRAADVTYYYPSWLPQDAANAAYLHNAAVNPALGGAGVYDYHFHPSEARTFRLTFVTKL